MIIYQCDCCQKVQAEKIEPRSWGKITIAPYNDMDDIGYLVCTACLTSFNQWLKDRRVIVKGKS